MYYVTKEGGIATYSFEDASDCAEFISENGEGIEDEFIDSIDRDEPPIDIMGITFDRSRVLRELDPTAYRCYLNDYRDLVRADIEWSLERISTRGESFYGYIVDYSEREWF